MSDSNKKGNLTPLIKQINRLIYVAVVIIVFCFIQLATPNAFSKLISKFSLPSSEITEGIIEDKGVANESEEGLIENGIHISSGLIVDDGYQFVLNNCGSCHSYKLVTQNRSDEQGWKDIIVWMQQTQKLWNLGNAEAPIIKYLAKNYGNKKASRRENLKNIDWYELK